MSEHETDTVAETADETPSAADLLPTGDARIDIADEVADEAVDELVPDEVVDLLPAGDDVVADESGDDVERRDETG
jgi:hypothetical protein